MAEAAYRRVYSLLRERILQGVYTTGEKLPTELELCNEFGVSRITSRHALRLLQDQGLVTRYAGRGTFVRAGRPRKVPIVDGDYIGSIRREAPTIERRLMSWSYVVPPSEISDTLELLESEQCHVAERLDLLDGEPLAYDRVFIPLEFGSSLGEDLLVSVDFLPVWLEREQIDTIHLKQSVEAVLPDEHGQELLRVSQKQPLLLVTEVIRGNRDTPLLAVSTYYRGDRFQLVSTTSGEAITHSAAYGASD